MPLLLALCLIFAPISALFGQISGESTPKNSSADQTQVGWHASATKVSASSEIQVALEMRHPEGWHSYFRNSGGIEIPLSIRWSLPPGWTAGPIEWPAPTVKDGFFGKSFIYEGSPTFLVTLKAPADLKIGTEAVIEAHASWQICKESCISETSDWKATFTVGETLGEIPQAIKVIRRAQAKIPSKPANWQISAVRHPKDVLLRLIPSSPGQAAPQNFIPNVPFLHSAMDGGEIRPISNGWEIRLPIIEKDALGREITASNEVSGVGIGETNHEIGPVALKTEVPAPTPLTWSALLPILGGMLIGGLILNLMPCVFPVIGLKIMGFVQQAGENRRRIMAHGLIFTAGVWVSIGLLAGFLFFLRGASADAPGWGYQLQEPRVVVVLMLTMWALGLNMAGLFEIGTSATSLGGSLQNRQGLAGTFFSGVLATIVATPCSAPFLGTALAVAVGLPAVQFFMAFAAMATGLALPYLVLSAFPRLIAFLPRPGAWMERFKQGMSFLLFGTAGYLLWVYAGQIGLENLLAPIFGLTALAAAAWIYGHWFLPHLPVSTRRVGLALTAIATVAGIWLVLPPKPSTITWETWSPAKVEALLDEGTPVYIDFTAQWCPTCQWNKKRAYTPEVVKLMKQAGVVALKADQTLPNPEIDAALRKLERTAIPVNVLLVPDRPPIILPELLSPQDIIDALKSSELAERPLN